ncbi:MAG TPA: 2-phosphosulfolactate phosphatase [bacterium]|nr:2-phosphosulfolactate phosphatase [bacterium]
MEVHVAFLPEEAGPLRGRIVVVIDVIRATTSVLAMLEGGCAEVLIAPTLEAARTYRRAHSEVLLAGEQHGRTPVGFDFGNSPPAFSDARLAGRRVVFATTNGTRAVHAARDGAAIFMGCLRNRTAAARVALAAAAGADHELSVMCAGREGRFSLDDAYTAGAIVAAAVDLQPDLTLTDAASAARMLYRSVEDPAVLFRQTRAGQNVIEIGLAGDLDYCAEVDRSSLVPKVGERVRMVAG